MKEDYIIKMKRSWYWYICAIPIVIGLLLVLLVFSGIISDSVGENGILIEDGYHTFALGCMLMAIGVSVIGILVIIKNLYPRFIRKVLYTFKV